MQKLRIARWISVCLKMILFYVVIVPACGSVDERVGIDTVDSAKLESGPADLLWIRNAFWPTDDTISQKSYRGNVDAEVTELASVLKRRLRPEYAPSADELTKGVIAVAELRKESQGAVGSEKTGPSDYLLFSYTSAAGLPIRVQDGTGLYVLVTSPDPPAEDIRAFAQVIAARVLCVPDEAPRISVRSADIGKSLVGDLHYGPRIGPLEKGREWYSKMGWWSDGKHVLFSITKQERADFDRLAELMATTMSTPPPIEPRRFKSRQE